jgi:hypothetical protein
MTGSRLSLLVKSPGETTLSRRGSLSCYAASNRIAPEGAFPYRCRSMMIPLTTGSPATAVNETSMTPFTGRTYWTL